jgi:Family of unknown function (DUF6308)
MDQPPLTAGPEEPGPTGPSEPARSPYPPPAPTPPDLPALRPARPGPPAQPASPRIINSRLTHSERDQVVGRAACAPWASVQAGADLADADPAAPAGLFASTAKLYWAFTWPERISGVAVAKVHKILHLKRPGLYPILDERIGGCTGERPIPGMVTSTAAGQSRRRAHPASSPLGCHPPATR